MSTPLRHPIKYVAQVTGLKPYLIRSWEERYAAVTPQRTNTNRRMYSDREIRRLILLRRAVTEGHTISAVAGLSDADLEALAGRSTLPPNDAVPARPHDATTDSATDPQVMRCHEVVAAAMAHVSHLDGHALEDTLASASVELPRQALLQQVIVPLFEQIGSLWRDGRLKIVNEHMASAVVRALLWDLLRSAQVDNSAPRALVATPTGHWHECGALASALTAAECGWRALYFGPNLPAEEIAYVARKMKTRALILSIGHCLTDGGIVLEIKQIRHLLGKGLPILVGGGGLADGEVKRLEGLHVEEVASLMMLRQRLEEMAVTQAIS
ncbi:MAG: MerR family transcriptional regulator [Desulfosarcinaceae bacterium]|nr:MerR family transcriptional regulator [Desulfosarcinaceae bacterium]